MATDAHQSDIVQAARAAATRIDESTVIDSASPKDIPFAVKAGATAVLCASPAMAKDVMIALKAANASAEIAAIGIGGTDVTCSGCYINPEQIASAAADLLTPTQSTRPAALWLAGDYTQRALAPMAGRTPLIQSLSSNGTPA
jgi:hypothetical protein